MVTRTRPVRPGYVVTYPNRQKRDSRTTRIGVAVVLAASALLMLVVTFGGWSKFDGLLAVNIIWALVYLVMAVYVVRWTRELLPIGVALGALMLVATVIAATAVAGVNWSDRNGPDYAPVHTVFGGAGLSPSTLSTLTLAIAITQALLIAVCVRAFRQGWNIEYEVPAEAGVSPRRSG